MEFTNTEYGVFSEDTEVFLAILDEDGLFQKANRRWLTHLDLKSEELIGSSIYEIIYEIEIGELEKRFLDVRREGQLCHQVVTIVDRKFKTYSLQFDLTFKDGLIYFVGFDVTDHSREHLSLVDMSQLSKTGAWYYDPIRDENYWTDEVYRIHDLEPGSGTSAKMALDFYAKEYRDKINELVDELYTKHKAYEFAGEIVTAKGNRKWIRTIAKPMVQDDTIIYVSGVTIDQTRLHKNLETIKRESETRMLALKGIKSALFDYDVVADLMYINPDFKEYLGITIPGDKIRTEELVEFIHPDDKASALAVINKDLKKKGDYYHKNQYRLRTKDGKYQYYEVYGWMKKDKDGKTSRMVGNLINVHDRKVVEEERNRVKRSLEAMVDNGFIYSMLLDVDGIIVMADQRTIDIIKHDYSVDPKREDVRYVDVMPDMFKKTFPTEFEKALDGQIVRKEVERPLLEGALQWLDVMYRPIKNDDGKIIYVLTNLMDITERKRAEISIKESSHHAQALNRLKSGILSNMSHEMRTPLNGIMGVTELLLSKGLDEEGTDLLMMQKESGLRMLKTLTNMITFSDLDTLRPNMRLSEHTIDELAEICYDMYNHQAKMKRLSFEIFRSRAEAIVLVDKEMMIAALGAIVNNALKYTETGAVKIICDLDERNWAEIKIEDTGIGIEKNKLDQIFDDFTKDNIGLNYKYEGSGIGLSIAKKFILLMGGSIDVMSEEAKGSQFVVRLPAMEKEG